jgi:hypothetical protein
MLTKLTVRNFKTLDTAEIPLGQSVVLIGPNNSGKTTALQALAIWQSGLQEWRSRRTVSSDAAQRAGVTLNRKALTHTPVSDARHLWHDLKVSANSRTDGKPDTQKIFLDISVEGEAAGVTWECGLEFYHCRPLRLSDAKQPARMPIPDAAADVRIALLPPMSGLASEEPEVQPGRVAVLIGEGQTAQVLRNLCLQVYQSKPEAWKLICAEIMRTFGIELAEPQRNPVRGSIELSYRHRGTLLDLSSVGRGTQQTLLLLAHLHINAGGTLLLDEPDAHLEILRQIIAASHSEVVLNEAADKDVVVAFVGRPHRIDDRGSQLLKSLKEIGFEQYYQAELTGFVIYLEGATDLAILRGFAKVLNHPAAQVLDKAFVHYVLNQPKLAEHHFYGLREAKSDLVAFALFDRLDAGLPPSFAIPCRQWKRREIENYLCTRDILLRYAEGSEVDDLVGRAQLATRRDAMSKAIDSVEAALKVLGRDPWTSAFKVSDDFLPAVFRAYFERLGTDNRLNKSGFHVLTDTILQSEIDPEVIDVLDQVVACATKAKTATG